MEKYKITYNYTTYANTRYGQQVRSYDIFEADSAQDAVDQCRDDFYIENELEIESVAVMTKDCYWMPVIETAWEE